jgi:hypothetical protein
MTAPVLRTAEGFSGSALMAFLGARITEVRAGEVLVVRLRLVCGLTVNGDCYGFARV